MTQILHIVGRADGQVVDLVIAEPKGRVLGLYRGANGEIALTAAEARFLLETLPAMVARAEYLDYMGAPPPLDPAGEAETQGQGFEIEGAPSGNHQIAQGEEAGEDSARVVAPTSIQSEGQGGFRAARSEPKTPRLSRARGSQRHRSGRARAGQRWNASEDTALISGYRAGQGIKELARIHGRSAKAIELRLERLGVCVSPRRAGWRCKVL